MLSGCSFFIKNFFWSFKTPISPSVMWSHNLAKPLPPHIYDAINEYVSSLMKGADNTINRPEVEILALPCDGEAECAGGVDEMCDPILTDFTLCE